MTNKEIIAVIIFVILLIPMVYWLYRVVKTYKKNEAEFKEWQKKTGETYECDSWHPDNDMF